MSMMVISQSWRTWLRRVSFAFFALAVSVMVVVQVHAASFGGGSGFVHDAGGKPVAGAHVIVYIMSRDTDNIPLPFGRSSPVCGPDFYTTTDAEGRFTIPESELAFPWKLSLFSERRPRFLAAVYAKDYVDNGIELRAGLETKDGADHKIGPIVLDVTMRPDTGTRVERAKYLSYIAGAGCRCWPFHDELNREYREVLSEARMEINRQHRAKEEKREATESMDNIPPALRPIKPMRIGSDWAPGNVMRCHP
jgi:hypothetical protein